MWHDRLPIAHVMLQCTRSEQGKEMRKSKGKPLVGLALASELRGMLVL